MADVFLAGAGAGDGAGAVIGVGAGTDDGGIADSSPALIRHAAGRCSRRQVPAAIEHRHPDGSLLALSLLDPLLSASIGREERVLDQLDTTLAGKSLGTCTGKQHMSSFCHHFPGQGDGVANGSYSSDGATGKIGTVHDGGIQFMFSLGVEDSTEASVEQRIVLEVANHLLDRIETIPTAPDDPRSDLQGGNE